TKGPLERAFRLEKSPRRTRYYRRARLRPMSLPQRAGHGRPCYTSSPQMTNSTIPPLENLATDDAVESARQVLDVEAQAVTALKAHIGAEFRRALEIVLNCRGRVVVCGIGKSGHIARKVAS